MIKRFFAPIWKCDEMEAELSRLEKEGWRLDKISGFRKFEFKKAQPKDKAYFFTFCLKERNMIDYEFFLKREYNANEIKGSFIDFSGSSIYRMPQNADLDHCKLARNFFLRYLVLRYVWLGLFFMALSIVGIILSNTVAELVLFVLFSVFSAVLIFPHLFGWIYLRKQYKKQYEKLQTSDLDKRKE